MLIAVMLVLVLHQASPVNGVVWSEPAPPLAAVPANVASASQDDVPAWALADPYAWERSECSPFVRREPSMEACQARVRLQLSARLGDALPTGLIPAQLARECEQVADGDTGSYAPRCGRPDRATPVSTALRERTCDARPQRLPGGGLAFDSGCRPGDAERPRDGISFRIGGDD